MSLRRRKINVAAESYAFEHEVFAKKNVLSVTLSGKPKIFFSLIFDLFFRGRRTKQRSQFVGQNVQLDCFDKKRCIYRRGFAKIDFFFCLILFG